MPVPEDRRRVFVVVLDPNLTDNAATSIRQGFRMFRGVNRVVPVTGVPDGDDVMHAIRQDVMGTAHDDYLRLRQSHDELAARLSRIQEECTGGIPAQTHEANDPLRDVPLWTRKDKSA